MSTSNPFIFHELLVVGVLVIVCWNTCKVRRTLYNSCIGFVQLWIRLKLTTKPKLTCNTREKQMNKLLISLLAVFGLSAVFADGHIPATVANIVIDSEAHTILETAVITADLAGVLSGEGPFTVFAPTDDAFAAALEALGLTAEELLASEGLAGILTYHVVAGNLMAADVLAAVEAGGGTAMVETVNGAMITVTVEDGMVMLNGSATVTAVDLVAGNGVVHVIDAVILPPAE
jgi:uncharacterized surface protein with fasciclin (FAS1) repeats